MPKVRNNCWHLRHEMCYRHLLLNCLEMHFMWCSKVKCTEQCSEWSTTHCPLHSAQCTLHTSHSTLHTAHFTQYTAHCTLQTAHFTLHTSHSTLHTVHFTHYTAHCTLHTVHCTLHLHSTCREHRGSSMGQTVRNQPWLTAASVVVQYCAVKCSTIQYCTVLCSASMESINQM